MEVGYEVKSGLEVPLDGVERQLKGSQSLFDVVELASEALLLAL